MWRLLVLGILPSVSLIGLDACATVAADGVKLRDIASPDTVLQPEVGNTAVFAAPASGATRWLSREGRNRILARWKLDLAEAGMCLQTASHTVAPEELRTAMLAAFEKAGVGKGTEIQVEIRDWSKYVVPDGPIDFSVANLPHNTDSLRPVVWRGHVRASANRSIPIWAKVVLRSPKVMLVALRDMADGHVIASGDCEERVQAVFPWPALTKPDSAAAIGKVVRRSLKAGDAVTATDLKQPLTVQPGQTLDATIQESSIRLQLRAVAETGGAAGDTIWMHPVTGGKRFRARIQSATQAAVLAADDNPRKVGQTN